MFTFYFSYTHCLMWPVNLSSTYMMLQTKLLLHFVLLLHSVVQYILYEKLEKNQLGVYLWRILLTKYGAGYLSLIKTVELLIQDIMLTPVFIAVNDHTSGRPQSTTPIIWTSAEGQCDQYSLYFLWCKPDHFKLYSGMKQIYPVSIHPL